MEHETKDTYIIPPNFIEGGTLLGGMFRTRNVIEAVTLALAAGLPVLGLGFSLTTRIILLCLTALPLALLAVFTGVCVLILAKKGPAMLKAL